MQGLMGDMRRLKSTTLSGLLSQLKQARLGVSHILQGITTKDCPELLLKSIKENKQIKRQILAMLAETKQAKQDFSVLRERFETCKLKLRTQPKYQPLKGDDVDKLISDWIYANNCPIPISRMGNGYYQFG
jgi:hypothetical protein